jgi:hypothetical protein
MFRSFSRGYTFSNTVPRYSRLVQVPVAAAAESSEPSCEVRPKYSFDSDKSRTAQAEESEEHFFICTELGYTEIKNNKIV